MITVIAVEMGLLTPPFGISVIVVKSTLGDMVTLQEVFLGVVPYVIAMAVVLALSAAFPVLILGVL